MIPGFFTPIMPQPFVRVAVHLPSIARNAAIVPFIFDTGAAFTCIHARDAIRHFDVDPAELDPDRWDEPLTIDGLGGGLRYRVVPASYGFQRDDGVLERIDLFTMLGELRSGEFPSLLGGTC